MSYEPPLRISISAPNEMPQGFGPNSTGKRGGNLRVRCTNAEYDAVKKEANLLGLTLAMFSRWSIVHVAQELKQHRDKASTSILAGDEDDTEKQRKRTRKSKVRRKK